MEGQAAIIIKACRLCASNDLRTLLSLGEQYVPDFVTPSGVSPKAPLELVRCTQCGLVQLRHTFSRKSLYKHYWYKSGISPTMRRALGDLASRTCEIAKPARGDVIVDIGCNDGTLLRSYPKNGYYLVGFEPASNLVLEAERGTDRIINDFFSGEAYTISLGTRQAKIVTSIAMFYDLDDPNRFVADVAKILSPDGVWVIQQNYLATMLEQNGFDNIGHEHLEYYSLGTIMRLLRRHGLEVFEAETNDVNGGSFRTFISHRDAYDIGESVYRMGSQEKKLALDDHVTYERFASNIAKLRSRIHEFVVEQVKKGKTVYVYGASNRGNTILQYCGLDHSLIKKATDANPEKWGRMIAGTRIPIISKEEARKDRPDFFLVLPHHFLEEIVKQESDYLDSDGRLIVPLPDFRVISKKK